MPNPEDAATQYRPQTFLQFLLIVILSEQLIMD